MAIYSAPPQKKTQNSKVFSKRVLSRNQESVGGLLESEQTRGQTEEGPVVCSMLSHVDQSYHLQSLGMCTAQSGGHPPTDCDVSGTYLLTLCSAQRVPLCAGS